LQVATTAIGVPVNITQYNGATNLKKLQKTNSVAFSSQANYTD
jgi:hypothetical protein